MTSKYGSNSAGDDRGRTAEMYSHSASPKTTDEPYRDQEGREEDEDGEGDDDGGRTYGPKKCGCFVCVRLTKMDVVVFCVLLFGVCTLIGGLVWRLGFPDSTSYTFYPANCTISAKRVDTIESESYIDENGVTHITDCYRAVFEVDIRDSTKFMQNKTGLTNTHSYGPCYPSIDDANADYFSYSIGQVLSCSYPDGVINWGADLGWSVDSLFSYESYAYFSIVSSDIVISHLYFLQMCILIGGSLIILCAGVFLGFKRSVVCICARGRGEPISSVSVNSTLLE
ncbi:hypothetical protein Pelo_9763 [Pelomyxa schiedti]|nr:hypothetical protein Pelo_9763 [Pelomyxa schiedti]